MSSYTIGEVAERSGFSASALRYYEGIGLVEPASRTDAGYRVYDDHTLARLAFIARAKQLGCSLEEISDLVTVWDGEQCGPVQRRFHELITAKIGTARRQLVELGGVHRPAADGGRAAQWRTGRRAVRRRLRLRRRDRRFLLRRRRVTLGAKPLDDSLVCTLEPGAMPDRLADWERVLDRAQARLATADGGLRIEFDADIDIGDLARLVGAEQRCCRFFAFAITVDHRGPALEVRAPESAAGIVADLFGTAA